jgi:hypothetical protein
MPTITCVKCERSLKVVKNGAWVVFMAGDPPEPYQIWSSDIYRCTKCGFEVCAGWSRSPLAEHHEPVFAELLIKAQIHDYER